VTELSQTASLPAALQKHVAGDFAGAEAVYRALLAANPHDAQALHYLGFLLQQCDRLTEARDTLLAAIALDAGHSEWHFNLGLTLFRLGELDAAVAAYLQALARDGSKYFYWTNLGVALEQLQRDAEAEQSFQAATRLDPHCPDAYYLLCNLCRKLGRREEARRYNAQGIVAAPEACNSKILVGQAYHDLGQTDKAVALFQTWAQAEPDNPIPAHLLTAYQAPCDATRCADDYVARTFDEFAKSFEDTLTRLQYSGPSLARDYVGSQSYGPASLDVLDLGCGTGWIGEILKPLARRLVGVDLSAAMLEKARAKQLYDALHQSDIEAFVRDSGEQYDLVACMDTLIYLGRLDALFAGVHARLRADGHFLFTTESHEAIDDFRLNISGRYSHAGSYVQLALRNAGFAITDMREVPIRKESGTPVLGHFVVARCIQ